MSPEKRGLRRHAFFAATILSISGGILAVFLYQRDYAPVPFPEEVAAEVRRALYEEHRSYKPNISKSIVHCRRAIDKAADLKLDFASNEISGLYIHLAGLYEKQMLLDKASIVYTEVLHHLKEALSSNQERSEQQRLGMLKRAIALSLRQGSVSF